MAYNRFENALFVNLGGACNPSGIAHSILDACKEMREEPGYVGTDAMRRDPAIGLMIHQLCHLYAITTQEFDGCGFHWDDAVKECSRHASAETLAMFHLTAPVED